MLTNLQAATIENLGTSRTSHAQARQIAAKRFDRAYGQAQRAQWWAKLSGQANELRTLSHAPKAPRRTLGTVIVPLDKIVGTEDRAADFDANFRPLQTHNRERWVGVAAARRSGVVLPAVALVQDGDEYYVRDGHHRISVAKALGQLEIEARIVNG